MLTLTLDPTKMAKKLTIPMAVSRLQLFRQHES